jgi:hypothetical protein
MEAVHARTKALALAVASLFAAGCFIAVGDVAELTRRVTYPPDFRYIEGQEIQGAMWQMALAARELNEYVQAEGGPTQYRGEILARLQAMEAAAGTLEQDGRPTNHPLLEWHLPRLLRDIGAARTAVEREPPSFLLAATVAGACLPCHSGAN